MFGIGGNKRTKDFTSQERGALRFKYYKRNVFWKKVLELIQAGYIANVAIDKIYQCYGVGSATTSIINAMIRDKKIGGASESEGGGKMIWSLSFFANSPFTAIVMEA